MARKPKFTRAQVKNHIKNIQETMDKQKREHEQKGRRFVYITPEEIEKKLRRVNSPFFIGQSFGPPPSPGGSFNYGLYIYNPDAKPAYNLYGLIWVGSGNVDPAVGTFLLNVDTRFPRLTQPQGIDGLQLDPSTTGSLEFTVQVPTTVERTTYFLQSCLMQVNWWDVGKYVDRAMFPLEVR